MEILKSETIKLENYLEDIEEVTKRYYPKGASVVFESFDNPISIHLPFPKEL
tara:strand:+ start:1893 stop:2048 length:156 start_codon:yes stop_codon:yes gene_type:complete